MKTLYLECKMGISGDMFFGSLLDLLPEPEKWIENFNSIGIPMVHAKYEKKAKCGVYGTHVSILANEMEEQSIDVSVQNPFPEHTHVHEHQHSPHIHVHVHEHGIDEHHHSHEHDTDGHHHSHEHDAHGHHHSHEHDTVGHQHSHEHNTDGHHHHHEHGAHGHIHATLSGIEQIIDSLRVSHNVKENAKAVYKLLAAAEASVHNTTIQDIHFHEVGTLDAIADIVGGCMLIEALAPDRIIASPVHVGSGHVHCAHGILPVPAPATAVLLQNIPFYSGQIEGELCTPTGAALLSYFADSFGPMPVLISARTGYGLGTKDFAAANMLRAFLGETWQETSSPSVVHPTSAAFVSDSDTSSAGTKMQGTPFITELRCTLDDMTPEAIGFVQDLLLEQGALDVVIIPVQMKKNRPGQVLCVTCRKNEEDKIARLLFQHTTTAGIRKLAFERYTLEYNFQTVKTAYGYITLKHYFGYGVEKYKPEYKDVAAAAKSHQISFQTVWQAAIEAAHKHQA